MRFGMSVNWKKTLPFPSLFSLCFHFIRRWLGKKKRGHLLISSQFSYQVSKKKYGSCNRLHHVLTSVKRSDQSAQASKDCVIFWQLGTKLVGSVLPRYLISFLINFPPVSDDIKAQFIAQATRWVLERYKKTRHPIFYYYSINSALRNSTRGIRPPAVF